MTLHPVRRTTRLLPVIAVAAVLSGCVAIKQPALLGPEPANHFPSSLVVGVQDPAIQHKDNVRLYGELSTNLIERLRATDLFSEVDFVKQLTRPPDVILSAHLGPAGRDARINASSYLLWMVTLGIVPIVAWADDGVYFSSIDQPDQIYSFSYRKDVVIGWAALLLNPSPGWSCGVNRDRYNGSLRRFLLENRDSVFTCEPASGTVTSSDTITPNQALEATPLRGRP